MPFDVTITAPTAGSAQTSAPTITWTLPSGITQSLYQIGAYRASDRTTGAPLGQVAPPPFDYHPVAASGYPNLPYGVFPDPLPIRSAVQQFTFDGSYPSTGALPTGTYIVWLHIISETYEDRVLQSVDNGVATVRFTVPTSLVAQPRRIRRTDRGGEEPPPPTIISPTPGQEWDQDTDGDFAVSFQVPTGISPDEVKIAIYDANYFDPETLIPTEPRFPIVYTDRAPFDAPTPRSAEWVDLTLLSDKTTVSGRDTWTVTFDGTDGTAQVPNGSWVMAIRYNTELTGRILSYDTRTGFVRAAHRYHASQSAVRAFTMENSFDTNIVPDPYTYLPATAPEVTWERNRIFNAVGSELELNWQYHNRRGVGQRSVQVRRVLSGGTNAGTRYLSRSSTGAYTWVTALDTSANPTTDIPIRSSLLVLDHGTAVGTAWGGLTWGTHSFAVRPTSQAGVQGDWSTTLIVDVYRALTLTAVTPVVQTNGFLRVSWTTDVTGSNNRQGRFRVQAFRNRQLISGTSERPEDQFQPTIPARAIIGSDSFFDFNRALPSKGPLPNGTYTITVTIWDKYGNQSQLSANITITNTLPAKVAATPHVYDWEGQVQKRPGHQHAIHRRAHPRRLHRGHVRGANHLHI